MVVVVSDLVWYCALVCIRQRLLTWANRDNVPARPKPLDQRVWNGDIWGGGGVGGSNVIPTWSGRICLGICHLDRPWTSRFNLKSVWSLLLAARRWESRSKFINNIRQETKEERFPRNSNKFGVDVNWIKVRSIASLYPWEGPCEGSAM